MAWERNIRAFLHIFVESGKLESVSKEITKLPEILDVYEVTGEFDLIVIVATRSIEEFREFLKNKILKIPGVRSTVTSIVLHIHKREGVETGE